MVIVAKFIVGMAAIVIRFFGLRIKLDDPVEVCNRAREVALFLVDRTAIGIGKRESRIVIDGSIVFS